MLSETHHQLSSLAQRWPTVGPFWSWVQPALSDACAALVSSHRDHPCSLLYFQHLNM